MTNPTPPPAWTLDAKYSEVERAYVEDKITPDQWHAFRALWWYGAIHFTPRPLDMPYVQDINIRLDQRALKTRPSFELWINYGQGWEHELTEWTIEAIRARVREYGDNCPQYPTKTRKRRIRLDSMTPAEQAEAVEADVLAASARRARARRRQHAAEAGATTGKL